MKTQIVLYVTLFAVQINAEQRMPFQRDIGKKNHQQRKIYPITMISHHLAKKRETQRVLLGDLKVLTLTLISGDAFRELSDFYYEYNVEFNPAAVSDGAIVFVKTDCLDEFFAAIHPNIHARYILITHNSDRPSPGLFTHHLDDPKIIGWLGQNPEIKNHPKFHPIPIGIANHQYKHGNVNAILLTKKLACPKKNVLYLNFDKESFPQERNLVYDLFSSKDYCCVAPIKDFQSYLREMRESMFVLSPRGNGLDCHRTWEALLMEAFPLVHTSPLDPLFADLPVIIVHDWHAIDEEFLRKKYEEICSKTYSYEKLYISYWRDYIRNILAVEGIHR